MFNVISIAVIIGFSKLFKNEYMNLKKIMNQLSMNFRDNLEIEFLWF